MTLSQGAKQFGSQSFHMPVQENQRETHQSSAPQAKKDSLRDFDLEAILNKYKINTQVPSTQSFGSFGRLEDRPVKPQEEFTRKYQDLPYKEDSQRTKQQDSYKQTPRLEPTNHNQPPYKDGPAQGYSDSIETRSNKANSSHPQSQSHFEQKPISDLNAQKPSSRHSRTSSAEISVSQSSRRSEKGEAERNHDLHRLNEFATENPDLVTPGLKSQPVQTEEKKNMTPKEIHIEPQNSTKAVLPNKQEILVEEEKVPLNKITSNATKIPQVAYINSSSLTLNSSY